MRGSFGWELGTSPPSGPFAQRSESLLNKALTRSLNGGDTRVHRFRNLFLCQLLVRFQ